MPEIAFFAEGARRLEHALVPTLIVGLRVVNGTPEPVHSMLVRCQVQVEPARRAYGAGERANLAELFGAPERWGETLRAFPWQQVTLMVPGFTGTTVAELPLACGFDFSLAATKYFEGVEQGDIPLRLLFAGTVFYSPPGGAEAASGAGNNVQAAPIAWHLEATYRLPHALWRGCLDAYAPDAAWLRLSRSTLRRLRLRSLERNRAASENAIEQTLCQVLDETEPVLQ